MFIYLLSIGKLTNYIHLTESFYKFTNFEILRVFNENGRKINKI